jgi:SAM-dependent methyltransferase
MAKRRVSVGVGTALELRLPRLVALWRELAAGAALRGASLGTRELKEVGAALLRLQRGLTGERGLAGAPYMNDPDLLGAYLLYYWPVSYVETSLAILELGLSPRRVLDLGSGPGPAAAAAIDAGALRVDLADGSERALELASRIFEGEAAGVGTSRVDLESSEVLSSDAERYDLIILGHCLNELWQDREDRVRRRADLLDRAARLLAPGGVLLTLEPALLRTSREAIALRDALSERGHAILGPCPASSSGPYPCPALASGPDRTCHAESAWDPPEPLASLAAEAGLDRRSVKYAWFAASPEAAAEAAVAVAIPALDEGTAVEGRVVSDPMLNKAGRVRYFICARGRIASLSAARTAPEARSSGFLSLRRGDRVRVVGAEARPGGGLGLVPGSSLTTLARAPEIRR